MANLKHIFDHFKRLDWRVLTRPVILSVLVGLVTGSAAVLFYFATNSVEHLFLDRMADFHPPGEGNEAILAMGDRMIDSLAMDHRWFLFLIPVIGGLVSGVLVFNFAPEAEGHGTDAAIDALQSAVDEGWLLDWWGLDHGDFDANYKAVLEDPGFKRLYNEIDSRVAELRESFRANPDLPQELLLEAGLSNP